MASITITREEITYVDSPVGELALEFEDGRLVRLAPVKGKTRFVSISSPHSSELTEYFNGARRNFSLPLELKGTPFQIAVWKAAQNIPYGKTATYADIAKQIGHPRAVRAVGTALGANPIPIIVPCHRVVPASGGIGNYALGSAKKKTLLVLEQSL